jgi:hypothetical protein
MVDELMQELTGILGYILDSINRGSVKSFGYSLIYRCADGEALCGTCVAANREQIIEATRQYFARESREAQWAVIGVESASDRLAKSESVEGRSPAARTGPKPLPVAKAAARGAI